MNPLDVLLRYPLFTLPPTSQMRDWLRRGQAVRLPTGETVFQEGSPGSWGYVLLSGRVRVVRRTDSGRDVTVGTVQPGELFGEYALLPPGHNTAGCRAAADCELWQFPLDPIRQWLDESAFLRTSLKSWLQLHFLLRYLRGESFLGFLSGPSALVLLRHLQDYSVPALRTLQADGLCEDHWFFVEEGELLLSAGEAPLRSVTAGGTLGEPALAGTGALPTAVALEPTRCLGLPREFFLDPGRSPRPREQSYSAAFLDTPTRVKWIGQKNAADCGVACLAMLAHYFGLPFTADDIRARVAVSPRGLALGELLEAARALSLAGQAVRISQGQLGDVHVPAIVHLAGGHYVVLFRLDDSGVQLGDPAAGLVTVSPLHFAAAFSGYLLLLRPSHFDPDQGSSESIVRTIPRDST